MKQVHRGRLTEDGALHVHDWLHGRGVAGAQEDSRGQQRAQDVLYVRRARAAPSSPHVPQQVCMRE